MARKGRKPRLAGRTRYVPEAFDIRADFVAGRDASPVTVILEPLTPRAERRVMMAAATSEGADTAELVDGYVLEGVREVLNYAVEDGDGQEIEIRTAEDLIEYGENEIVFEVGNALRERSALEAGDLGKLSSSRSGGNAPETLPSNGSVPGVSPTSGGLEIVDSRTSSG